MKENRNVVVHTAYDEQDSVDPSRPEKDLLRAILLSAISDLRKSGAVGRKAHEYFLSQEDDYLFSFRSVCGFLSIDPKSVLILTGLSTQKEKK